MDWEELVWYYGISQFKREEKKIRAGKVGYSHQRVGLLHRRMHGMFFEVVIMSFILLDGQCLCYTHTLRLHEISGLVQSATAPILGIQGGKREEVNYIPVSNRREFHYFPSRSVCIKFSLTPSNL
jgi:hypothetical protein